MDLQPEETRAAIVRMKRAHGHLASVIRMLEEGADRESVLTQLAALNKALSCSGYAIFAACLQRRLAEDGGEPGDINAAKLEKLFLALA